MTTIRFADAQCTADTSTFDVTIAGETRTPTGVVVFGNETTANDTDEAEAQWCLGVSDFTTTACVTESHDDGDAASDTHRTHSVSALWERYTAGTATLSRSCTAAAISGGVRFTPVQSGTQYRFLVMLVFGSACKAFSDGNGTLATNTFAIAHGLTNAPKAGIFGYTEEDASSSGEGQFSLGFASMDGSIKQGCIAIREQNGQGTTDVDGYNSTGHVAIHNTANGNVSQGIALTANNSTNTTFTASVNTLGGELIGLLIEADDISTDMNTVTVPNTAASDWNYNGLSFTSQAVLMGLTHMNATNINFSASNLAGCGGIYVADEAGVERSNAWCSENGRNATVSNTNTSTRQDSDGCYFNDHAGVRIAEFSNISFTADGFDVLAADLIDIEDMDWPMLFFEKAPATITARGALIGGPIGEPIGGGIG